MTSYTVGMGWMYLQVFWWHAVVGVTVDNMLLQDSTFVTLQQSSLYDCGATCLQVESCLSMNFMISTLQCNLNLRNSSTNSLHATARAVFMDKSDLIQRFGRWSDTTSYDSCESTSNSGCQLPTISMGNVLPSGRSLWWPEGATLKFECHRYAFPTTNTAIQCVGNNQWIPGECKRPASCAELQRCNSNYNDGDYWLHPDVLKGERVKLFCSHMNTSEPKEYVSLVVENIGIFPKLSNEHCEGEINETCSPNNPPGTAIYRKIKVAIETMEVNRTDVTYATVDGTLVAYGEAKDCYAIHYNGVPFCGGPKGTFNIDLTGTGFAVHTNVRWSIHGWNPYMLVTPSSDRTQIDLRCGGWSGECRPDGPFVLDFYSNSDVPSNSATTPSCTK